MFKHKHNKWLAVLLIVLLVLPGALFAATTSQDIPLPSGFHTGDRVNLPAGETVKGPGFFSGNNISIEGNVDGTTFAAGQTIEVNGKINGDLFVAAQDIIIRGEVSGNIYGAGQNVLMDNHTTGDLFLAGQSIRLTETSQAARDVFTAGATVSADGIVGRQLFSGSDSLRIGGTIGDDVYAGITTLSFKDGAVIEGSLNYQSEQPVEVPATVTVQGDQNWSATEAQPAESGETTVSSILLGILFALLSGLLIWLIAELIRPTFWAQMVDPLFNTPLKAIGFGILAAIVIIPLSIVFMISVIGIPAGFIILGVSAILIAVSKVVAAAALNHWAVNKFNLPRIHLGIWTFLAALLVVIVLTKLPYVGFIFTLIAIFITFGVVVLRLFTAPYRPHRTPPAATIEPGYHHPEATN